MKNSARADDADLLAAGDGDDVINGSDGPDALHGGAGIDHIYGNGGNDTIYGEAGADVIQGGADNDTIYAYDQTGYISTDADSIDGGDGNDAIFGSTGINNIQGGAGDDYIDGGGGADVLSGGIGNDVLIARGNAGATIDGGDDNDLIYGSDGADIIHGNSGNDRIYGNAGDDTIYGDAGDDMIDGGAGNDTIAGGAGADLILGSAGNDTLYAFAQNLAGDDNAINYLYGDFGTNLNEAGSGADNLFGGGGNDFLFGEGGTDSIVPGGAGSWVDAGTTTPGPVNTFLPPLPFPPDVLTNFRASGISLPNIADSPGRWGELSGSGSGTGLSGDLGVALEPAIVAGASAQFVAWADARSGNFEIYVARHVSGQWQEGLSSSGAGGVQFAEVEVDTDTGFVKVKKITCVQDGGLIVSKLTCESQVNGGILMGIGYALYEERVMDRTSGVVLNPNFETYKLVGLSDIPEIDILLLDMPERGVIGIGEPVTIPTAAAVANAVANALGVRVGGLPITPARVLEVLGKSKATADDSKEKV